MDYTYLKELNSISNKVFGKDFKDLTLEEKQLVYKLEKRNSDYIEENED